MNLSSFDDIMSVNEFMESNFCFYCDLSFYFCSGDYDLSFEGFEYGFNFFYFDGDAPGCLYLSQV